jgi:hypothetical protein
MAVTDITLEYSATEQRLKDWGFTEPVLTLVSQGKGIFNVRAPGKDLTAAADIPFEGAVKIRDSLGGNLIFQGRNITRRGTANPNARADLFSFADAWYDLENTPFMQTWKYFPIGGGAATTKSFSRLNLFYNQSTGALVNNGDQIKAIINYAISTGANLQLGTVTPAFNLPVYPTKCISCAEAILLCLRPCPDAQTWIDYTTTPPTFNCKQRSGLTTVSLAYSDGAKHKQTDITPRPDLIASGVLIDYQKTNSETSGGNTDIWITFATDAYPALFDGKALRAVVLPIDLRGAALKVQALTAGAFDPTTKDWWKKKKRDLVEVGDSPAGLADNVTVDTSTVKVYKPDGTDVTAIYAANYANEMTDGVFASWMKTDAGTQIVVQEVIVQANLSWKEVSPTSANIELRKHDAHQVSVRTKLTNSAVGSVTYSTVSQFDEIAPSGLAQAIYDALSTLQYEGEHEIVEKNISQIVGPQNVLNITGGAAAWATMKASIQSVRHEFFTGNTAISFGPPKHIAPGDLIALSIWSRTRQVFEDPSIQKTGQISGANGSAELGKNTPRENTAEGLPMSQKLVEAHDLGGGLTGLIVKDANQTIAPDGSSIPATQAFQMHQVNTVTGIRDDSKGGVDGRLSDCLCSDGTRRILKFVEVDICVSGTPMKMKVWGTVPF